LPRKPNYKFERLERERAKAAKKAARLQARADKKAGLAGEGEAPDENSAETPAPDGETPQD
jgi:hypothetical protein